MSRLGFTSHNPSACKFECKVCGYRKGFLIVEVSTNNGLLFGVLPIQNLSHFPQLGEKIHCKLVWTCNSLLYLEEYDFKHKFKVGNVDFKLIKSDTLLSGKNLSLIDIDLYDDIFFDIKHLGGWRHGERFSVKSNHGFTIYGGHPPSYHTDCICYELKGATFFDLKLSSIIKNVLPKNILKNYNSYKKSMWISQDLKFTSRDLLKINPIIEQYEYIKDLINVIKSLGYKSLTIGKFNVGYSYKSKNDFKWHDYHRVLGIKLIIE